MKKYANKLKIKKVWKQVRNQKSMETGSKARWLGKLSDKCIYHWNKEINTMKLNFVLNSKSIIPQDWTIVCWHDKAGNWHQ